MRGADNSSPANGFAGESGKESRRAPAPAQASRRGVSGLADQGVVSFGNFSTNILLARLLSERDFGRFALLFDVMLILNSLTAATICYPLSVRGASGGRGRLRRYVTGSIALTLAALVPLASVVMVTATMLSGRPTVGLCSVFALVCWQLQETTRRGLAAHCRFFDALWGDGVSYVGQALGIFVLGCLHHISLESVFACIGLTSLFGFCLQWLQIGPRAMQLRKIAELGTSFWRPGRWMLLSSLVSVVSVQAFSWLLAIHGIAVVGDYQSLVNLIRVANPIIGGISGIIIPAAARARVESGIRAAWQAAMHHAAQGAALLMPYYVVLLTWPRHVLAAMYGENSPYIHFSGLLRIYVAANVLFYFAQMLLTFTTAVEQVRAAFYAQFATMMATIIVSLPLTIFYGLPGIIWGVFISIMARFVSALVSLRSVKWSGEISAPEHPAPAAA
jgi:O-antigen/teichoic acid export membrane protein